MGEKPLPNWQAWTAKITHMSKIGSMTLLRDLFQTERGLHVHPPGRVDFERVVTV